MRCRGRLAGRFSPGLLLAAGMCAVLPVLAQPPADAPSLSRFQRTAQYLREASPDAQADFAFDAVTQLVEVYMAEADLARTEARGLLGAAGAGLRGWALAVDQYANQLLLVLDDVEQGYPVDLHSNREGAVSLGVAGRAVMLVHPRPGQQGAFEQQVLNEFCARHDCAPMTAVAGENPRPIPMSAKRVNPVWTFTDQGPVCAHDGLSVHFGTGRQLAGLRDFCSQLMQELASLALELAWQQHHGVAINWAALDIVATPGKPGHVVHLNLAGDSVFVTVPLLAASEGILTDITPWLRARSSGQDPGTLQLDAAAYGWTPPR